MDNMGNVICNIIVRVILSQQVKFQ